MSIRNLVNRHQFIFAQLHAAAVRVIRKREILDAIEIGFTCKRILTHLHVRIAEEHSRSASAPQERFLYRFAEIGRRFNPHATLKINIAYAESRPLAFLIILETFVDQLFVAVNRFVIHELLLKFKAAQPKVVRVFIAELADILQKRIVRMNFFGKKFDGFFTVKLKNRLNPRRTLFHIFNKETILVNSSIDFVQRTQSPSAFFPQIDTGTQIKRTLFQAGISGVFELHNQRRIFLSQLGIQYLNGIQQVQAVFHFVLGARKFCVCDLFGKGFGSAEHFTQPADRSVSRIPIRCTARQNFHVKSLRLLQLIRIFQVTSIAILQRYNFISTRIVFEEIS